MEKQPLSFTHSLQANNKQYAITISVHQNGSLRIQTTDKKDALSYELLLDKKAVSDHPFFQYMDLESFIEIYKQKAAKNIIKLNEHENRESIRVIIQFNKKPLEFVLKMKAANKEVIFSKVDVELKLQQMERKLKKSFAEEINKLRQEMINHNEDNFNRFREEMIQQNDQNNQILSRRIETVEISQNKLQQRVSQQNENIASVYPNFQKELNQRFNDQEKELNMFAQKVNQNQNIVNNLNNQKNQMLSKRMETVEHNQNEFQQRVSKQFDHIAIVNTNFQKESTKRYNEQEKSLNMLDQKVNQQFQNIVKYPNNQNNDILSKRIQTVELSQNKFQQRVSEQNDNITILNINLQKDLQQRFNDQQHQLKMLEQKIQCEKMNQKLQDIVKNLNPQRFKNILKKIQSQDERLKELDIQALKRDVEKLKRMPEMLESKIYQRLKQQEQKVVKEQQKVEHISDERFKESQVFIEAVKKDVEKLKRSTDVLDQKVCQMLKKQEQKVVKEQQNVQHISDERFKKAQVFIEAVNKDVEKLKRSTDVLDNKVCQMLKKHDQKVGKKQKKLEAVEVRINKLEQRINQHFENIDTRFQEFINAPKKYVEKLKTTLEKFEKIIQAMQQEIKQMDLRLKQLEQKEDKPMKSKKDDSFQEFLYGGKYGDNLTREVDTQNRTIRFDTISGYCSWQDRTGIMGYFSENKISYFKLTFYGKKGDGKKGATFGIARGNLDYSKYIGKTVAKKYPFYGIFPYDAQKYKCNIPKIAKSMFSQKYQEGEQFLMSFDTQSLLLSFECGRLKKKIVTKVVKGKYFPIVQLDGGSIEIEFIDEQSYKKLQLEWKKQKQRQQLQLQRERQQLQLKQKKQKEKQQLQLQRERQQLQLKQKKQKEQLAKINSPESYKALIYGGKMGSYVKMSNVDLTKGTVRFQKTGCDGSYSSDTGTMGYLSQNHITQLKLTFSKNDGVTFGIGRSNLDYSKNIYSTVDQNYPFYGHSTRNSKNWKCNIADIEKYVKTTDLEKESICMSFDPSSFLLTLEGQRFHKMVVVKVQKGKYFPVFQLYWNRRTSITVKIQFYMEQP